MIYGISLKGAGSDHEARASARLLENGIIPLFAAVIIVLAVFASSCGGGKGVIGPGPGIAGTPVAVGKADPLIGDSPVTVTLSAAGSYDPDGKIVRWQWDFDNDGTYDWSSTTSGTVVHEYPAGEHTAKLLVTDDSGKSATATVENIFSNPAHLYWTFEKVDGGDVMGEEVGRDASINIDPRDGRPCIVYHAGFASVKASWRNADGSFEIDGWDFGHQILKLSNAALLPDGTILVAIYWRGTLEQQLSAAWRSPEGQWRSETIDQEGRDIGDNPMLAIDDSGEPVVTYLYRSDDQEKSINQLRYAIHSSSGWLVETPDLGFAMYPAWSRGLACAGGIPYILISKENNLVLAERQQDGHWTQQVVGTSASGPFRNAGLLKYNGSIAVLAGYPSPGSSFFYWREHAFWNQEIVDTPTPPETSLMPGPPSIASNGDKVVALIGAVENPHRVHFAYRDGSQWRRETIASGELMNEARNSICIGGDSKARIAIYMNDRQELWYGERVALP